MISLCWSYVKKRKFFLYIYVLFTLASAILSIFIPVLLGELIDIIINGNVEMIKKICFIIVALTIISYLLNYGIIIFQTHIQTKASYEFNIDMISQLQHQSMSFFTQYEATYLTQRLNNDCNTLILFFLELCQNFIFNFIKVSLSLFIIIKINEKIGFLFLVIAMIHLIVYFLFKKHIYHAKFENIEAMNEYFTELNNQFLLVKFIKINLFQKKMIEKLDKKFRELFKTILKYCKTVFFYENSENLILIICRMLIYFFGGLFVMKKVFSIGSLMIILSLSSTILTSLTYFVNVGQRLQETKASYDRINELVINHSLTNENSPYLTNIKKISIINFKKKFGNKTIINGLNFEVKKGNIYGIVGSNGIGKSTLIEVLIGLYNSEYEGTILFDDSNIKELNMNKTRETLISFMEQSPVVIFDELYSNITMNLEVNNEYMENLIEIFELNYLIKRKKLKKLSEGEIQKIAICRVLLKQGAKILIFDEPTAALDYDSKMKFKSILTKIKSEYIIIIISHDGLIENIYDETITL